MEKKKVHILGAGMSSLTTAYELSSQDNWQNQYDITVHVLGWRCGGKTSTGRGPSMEVREVGIHILQGWYDHTFAMMQDVYKERQSRGIDPKSPYQDFMSALVKNNTTLLTEYKSNEDRWVNWPLIIPENDLVPGQGPDKTVMELMREGVAIVLELILGSPYAEDEGPIADWILDHFFPSGSKPSSKSGILGHILSSLNLKKTDEQKNIENLESLLQPLSGAVNALGKLLDRLEDIPDRVRRLYLLGELAVANLKGVLADVYDPKTGQFNFANIQDIDYRAWIMKHGASKECAQFVVVRFFYTGTFANQYGGNQQGGAIGAGTALQFVLASLGYKGAFVYQMKAGTGDTLVMPLFQVLRARGVKFEFFTEVLDIQYSPTGSIEELTMAKQVELKDGNSEYEPAIDAPNNISAWPDQPLYDQLNAQQAEQLQQNNVNLEDPWANWKPVDTFTLKRANNDFDLLVLGIPVGVLPSICPTIVEKMPSWQQMTTGVKGTATMSMQLWLKPSLEEMGFQFAEWGLPEKNGAPNCVTYENPQYSWLDQSLVLENEAWSAPEPKLLAYYCGAMNTVSPQPPYSEHSYPQEQTVRVQTISEQWLQDNMSWFWPNGAAPEAPQGLDWSLVKGSYYRANVAPSYHYTLSVPGSDAKRLKTDESGFDNLFLCGDWTNFGINVGYIEGAVISGKQAAEAVASQVIKVKRKAA